MKKMLTFTLVISIACITIMSCSKDGTDGTDGTDGKDGATGAQGPAGQNGNANITAYTFPAQTFTSSLDLVIPNITQSFIDSSLVLVYYNPLFEAPTTWYPVPGLGSGGLFDVRYFLSKSGTSNYLLSLRLQKSDGSGLYASAVTFTKIKVLFAKPTTIIPLARGLNNAVVDHSDYHAVCKYYNTEE